MSAFAMTRVFRSTTKRFNFPRWDTSRCWLLPTRRPRVSEAASSLHLHRNPADKSVFLDSLSFYDESGNPLAIPLAYPQTGTVSFTATVKQTLTPGQTLIMQTQGRIHLPRSQD